MYLEEGSFAEFEDMVDDRIPLTTLKPIADVFHRDVLIVYGGSTRPEFRNIVKKTWGEELAHCGLTVHCFDFQSNVAGNDFNQFGLWDRIMDTQRVLRFLASRPNRNPLAVVGVSMGGYIASYLASIWKDDISKLVLVAPAAYHDAAIQPGIKFGKGTREKPRLKDILNDETLPYQASGVFKLVENIISDVLIIAYEDDEVVKENPMVYLSRLVDCNKPQRAQKIIFVDLPGGHVGSFEDPERIKLLMSLFTEFIIS